MITVGFDTATAATAVAAANGGEPAFSGVDEVAAGERPRHAIMLLPMVEQAAEAAGGWDAVGRIAVGIGPGTFTGIRIGVVTARALATARNTGLIGVETSQAIASKAARESGAAACAVIDGKRGEVFAAAVGRDGQALWGPLVEGPQDLVRRLGESGFEGVLAGDGAVLHREAFASAGCELADAEFHRIDPLEICRLAGAAEPVEPASLLPLYLRRPDAERWNTRGR